MNPLVSTGSDGASVHSSCQAAYKILIDKYRVLNQKLKAVEHLTEALKEKDDIIDQQNEKIENLQLALNRDETQIAKMLYLKNQLPEQMQQSLHHHGHAAEQFASLQHEKVPPCSQSNMSSSSSSPMLKSAATSKSHQPLVPDSASGMTTNRRELFETSSFGVPDNCTSKQRKPASDLEVDGSRRSIPAIPATFEPEKKSSQFISQTRDAEKFVTSPLSLNIASSELDKAMPSIEESLPADQKPNMMSSIAVFKQSTPAVSMSVSSVSVSSASGSSASVSSTSVSSASNSTLLQSSISSLLQSQTRSESIRRQSNRSEISHDMISKLMTQNGRLKKVLKDILQVHGVTLSDYLDKKEYEDVVTQLQHEIKQHREAIEKLRAINESSCDDVKKTAFEQAEKIVKLEKSLMIQKAMVMSYSQQLDKQKRETSLPSLQSSTKDAVLLSENNRLKVECTNLHLQLAKINKELDLLRAENSQLLRTENFPLVESTKLSVCAGLSNSKELSLPKSVSHSDQPQSGQLNSASLEEGKSQILENRQKIEYLESQNEKLRLQVISCRTDTEKAEQALSKSLEQNRQIIAMFSHETQIGKAQLMQEKKERAELQAELDRVKSTVTPLSFVTSSKSIERRTDIGIDGDVSSLISERSPVVEKYVCERCDKEFTERPKWETHMTRCTN